MRLVNRVPDIRCGGPAWQDSITSKPSGDGSGSHARVRVGESPLSEAR